MTVIQQDEDLRAFLLEFKATHALGNQILFHTNTQCLVCTQRISSVRLKPKIVFFGLPGNDMYTFMGKSYRFL